MNTNNYQFNSELSKAKRDPELWFDQFTNITSALFWGVGIWVAMNILMFGAISIGVFLTYDGNSYISLSDFQEVGLKTLSFTSVISALIVTLFGLPRKLINVFDLYAKNRIESCDLIKKKIVSSIEISEKLMIRHGLISKEDIEKRKSQLKPGCLL